MVTWPLLLGNVHPVFLAKRHFVCMGIFQGQHSPQPARPLQGDAETNNHAAKNILDVVNNRPPDNTSWIEGAYQIDVANSGVKLEHLARTKGHLCRVPQQGAVSGVE